MPKVSVVIPNWNGQDKLAKNLPAVLELEDVFEVIVVDDHSSDGSVSFIKNSYPSVKVFEKDINSGFAKSVNFGVSKASGDLIFLLNSDAKPAKDAVRVTIPHFKDLNVFSVSCNTGGNWSWIKFDKGYLWHYMQPFSQKEKLTLHQTLWASGGSGIFRKSYWEELGGLDELFSPFYEEDTDLGYRATKRGFINLWDPKSKVDHPKNKGVIAQNFKESFVKNIAQRNQLLFIWKNLTDQDLLGKHIVAILKNCLTHPSYLKTVFSALIFLPQIRKRRTVETSYAKLSDKQILEKYTQT